MSRPTYTLQEKVAQLFLVGSDTVDLNAELESFYQYGLGGLILFRHHLQPFDTAGDLRAFLTEQRHRFAGAGLGFIGIDQEGGQVERLPHWLFPTGLLPIVFGLKNDPTFCGQVNREVARRLRWLGFNLNFTPTVDLDTAFENPIIGVRAYGSTANHVLPFARTIIDTHLSAGVLPVAKHFPGHGSGTVDSHYDLPTFDAWSEEELIPYESLIRENTLPAILAAHGLYPELARRLHADPGIPASLSNAILTGLLRQAFGFNGLIFTDDLMMGAVWGQRDPAEVALEALEAGADMLVYRRAQPEAWLAFETIVSRVQRGKLSESVIDDRLERLMKTQAALNRVPMLDYAEESFSQEACHQQALEWARTGLTELHHQFISPLPLTQATQWALVMPDRRTMRHYDPDSKHGLDLLGWCQHYGVVPVASQTYPITPAADFTAQTWAGQAINTIVFIAFNSHLNPGQVEHYERLKASHPNAKVILASCGMPHDKDVLSKPWVHIQLPSFRPAAMQAFVQWLISTPRQTDTVQSLSLPEYPH